MTKQSSFYKIIFSTLLLTACSKSGYDFQNASKTEAISKAGVFGDADGYTPIGGDGSTSGGGSGSTVDPDAPPVGGDGSGGGQTGGGQTGGGQTGGGQTGGGSTVDPNTPPVGGDGNGVKLPVQFVCSDKYVQRKGGKSLASVADINIVVALKGKTICEFATQSQKIQSAKSVDLSSCSGLDIKNVYNINVFTKDSSKTSLLARDIDAKNGISIKYDVTKKWIITGSGSSKLDLLLDMNHESSIITSDNQFKNPLCGELFSPLVINMTPASKKDYGMMLTSPARGIQFDLIGENQAVAHTKVQISWIRNNYYMFLALPDASGSVHGINQLFGDNTRGPDGKFATDGYHALAKYDSNSDGLIDEKDPIYSQLRLWSDVNRNGRSDRGELYALKSAMIKAIDLKYDARFFEQDKYGNQSRMKSVVIRDNGQQNVIFDLWFIVK